MSFLFDENRFLPTHFFMFGTRKSQWFAVVITDVGQGVVMMEEDFFLR